METLLIELENLKETIENQAKRIEKLEAKLQSK
jgi:hypothetical protein